MVKYYIRFLIVMAVTSCLPMPVFAEDGSGTERPPSKAALEEAQRHYKRGVELFKNAVYDAALIEFKRAYETAPSYKIHYNIGQVSRQLDDYASAVNAYQRYLNEGGSNVPAARQAEVRAELERIEQWVGRIEISSSSPEVEIIIDDVVIGRTPLGPVLVNAGRRRVMATLVGHPTLTRVVDVAGGETEKLAFDFTEHTVQAPSKPTPESSVANRQPKGVDHAAKPTTSRSAVADTTVTSSHNNGTPWLLWGGTALLAAGAVGVGALAIRAENELDDIKQSPARSTAEYDSAHSKMTRLAVVADVVGGLAVVTGGFALYMTLRPSNAKRDVGVVVSPNGIFVRQAF